MNAFTTFAAAAAVVLSPLQVSAQGEDDRGKMLQWCEIVSQYAALTMTARQNGWSLSEVLSFAERQKEEGLEMAGLIGDFALAAFDRPQFTQEEYQQRSIKEFSSKAMLQCIRSW